MSRPVLITNVMRKLTEEGLRSTIAYSSLWVSEHLYEMYYGMRTAGILDYDRLGYRDTSNNYYVPTTYRDFRSAMKHIDIDKHKDVFLDYGSGMGRVVIMAATYPFRKVIGVEVSPELTAIARTNIEITRWKRVCQDVDLICEDAARYQLPADVTVIYFFSPFGGDVLAKVLENIHLSLVDRPRKLRIIYLNPPYFREQVSHVPWLKKKAAFRASLEGVIYETNFDES